jgi:dihydroflavonol-4-reductase
MTTKRTGRTPRKSDAAAQGAEATPAPTMPAASDTAPASLATMTDDAPARALPKGALRILVTGGTGFLGAQLVPKLLKAGHTVRLISRGKPPSFEGAREGQVEHVSADLRDEAKVKEAVTGIDVVYHLAGRVSRDPKDGRSMYELHVDCTRALLRACRDAKVKRFILASSSGTICVFKEERVGTEADDYPIETVGKWPYYLSKIYEEKLTLEFCKKHQLPLVVLNPGLLIGPGDDRLSSTGDIVKFLNRDIPAMPSGGLAFIDVRDAAEAFFQALTRGELYSRHLMGVNMSLSDYFLRLQRMTGVSAPPRLPVSNALKVLGTRALGKWAKVRGVEPPVDEHSVAMGECFFYLDSSKAERELGFVARDPQETLYDTVQYILSKLPPGHLPGVKGKLTELRAGT